MGADKIGGGKRGPGRPKGMQNKITREVKAAIEAAFWAAQRNKSTRLSTFAKEHPEAFYTLVARILPREITGKGGGPIEFKNADVSHLTESELAALAAGQITDELLERLRSPARAPSSSGA